MSVTNKPNDGEPIVLKRNDPVFGETYIATPVFWRFLDELTDQANQTASDVAQDPLTTTLAARIAEIEYQITDDPFTVDSTGITVDSTFITADWTKA